MTKKENKKKKKKKEGEMSSRKRMGIDCIHGFCPFSVIIQIVDHESSACLTLKVHGERKLQNGSNTPLVVTSHMMRNRYEK